MKRDCSTCVYKEGSCYPSTTIFDKDKTCKSYKPDYEGYIVDLEKENAELKLKLEALEGQTPWKDIKDKSELIKEIADLEKENAELKKLFADCDTCKRTCDIGNCCKFGSDYLPDVEKVLNEQKQLTKAKEIIKYLLSFIQKENYKTRWDINITAAEQFLKSEVEK